MLGGFGRLMITYRLCEAAVGVAAVTNA
jgi:hypothetical protein